MGLTFSTEGMSLLQDPAISRHLTMLRNSGNISAEATAFTYLICVCCGDSRGRLETDDETIAAFWTENEQKLEHLMDAITGKTGGIA